MPNRSEIRICHYDYQFTSDAMGSVAGFWAVTAQLMIQGTGTNAGKSLLVAGLCRYFSREGLRVRPFKPQNMSNNAAVTTDGGEIGRAQALQARACGVEPVADMNPVLLKPQVSGSQLIVRGQMRGAVSAREYVSVKKELMRDVLDAYECEAAHCDLMIVEGAGSPAEANLRRNDIANMGFALAAGVPVLLAADIDRGGVLASLVGTERLMLAEERALTKGYIINKFRGDPTLFDNALPIIHDHTGWSSMGTVTWFDDLKKLPPEDSLSAFDHRIGQTIPKDGTIRVVVPRLPFASNLDDLDPLHQEQQIEVTFLEPGQYLPVETDLVVLPGSKAVIRDRQFLQDQGWDIDILAHYRRGGHIMGLCGGFQILGRMIHDPEMIEGGEASCVGLGLLDMETMIEGDKALRMSHGHAATGEAVSGYEIHLGKSVGAAMESPLLRLQHGADGATSADRRVQGCYLHGLFTSDPFRKRYFQSIRSAFSSQLAYEADIDRTLDEWASHLAMCLDMDAIRRIAGLD